MKTKFLLAIWITLIVALWISPRAALAELVAAHPFNRIVVIIDRSGSFKDNLLDACKVAWKYIRDLSNTSADDEVYIIGVDNSTSQITYIKGVRSRRLAKKEFEAAFQQHTHGYGTDFVTGLRLAATDFALRPKPTASHLLCFGDLSVDDNWDPGANKLICRFERLDAFDWSAFNGVHCQFWFADDKVRQKLLRNPGFVNLSAPIYSLESRARAQEIQPPDEISTSGTPEKGTSESGGSFPMVYVVGIVVILALLGAVTRLPNGGNTR